MIGEMTPRRMIRRTIMSQKLENLLVTLAPLILIIVVSWVFSYLSARLRKKTEQAAPSKKSETGKDLMDIFLEGAGPTDSPEPGELRTVPPGPPIDAQQQGWHPDPASPRVTPHPIKPRWWGA
jgi:hypothetical protein